MERVLPGFRGPAGSVKMHRNASVALMLSRRSKLALQPFHCRDMRPTEDILQSRGGKQNHNQVGFSGEDKASTGPGPAGQHKGSMTISTSSVSGSRRWRLTHKAEAGHDPEDA